MSQLMQEARKDLEKKPIWMREDVWAQLKAYWKSSSFKSKSETNKRNCVAMDGASLHTGGSIPHRLHWKRMDKFEQRKSELTSQSHMENASDGEQSIHEYPYDWDIWIDSVGKKKGRIFGI
ncbi:putative transposase [Vigna unguiculata]|uniref:Putative transposase n=1 Tax=Vigna unguiculata TaxID=3917 RepID=A0A4D6L226_VIGUN|nr:putative transposase [Vigna unguiculata]